MLAVDVYVDPEPVEAVKGSRGKGFPGLADLELAVAHEHPGLALLPLDPARQRDPGGLGQALTKRAGGHLHAGRVFRADHLHRRAVAIEVVQSGWIHAAGFDEQGVQHQRVVGRGKEEPVLVRKRAPVELGAGGVEPVVARGNTGEGPRPQGFVQRREVHHLQVQGGENFGR